MAAHDLSELLSDAEVKAVLQRAAEIDRTGGAVSVAELEHAAVEAGIDSAALMKAVGEVLARRAGAEVAAVSQSTGVKQTWRERARGKLHAMIAAVGGLWGGVLVGLTGDDGWAFLASWVGVGVSLLLASRYRRSGSRVEMQAQLLALWAGFLTGYSLIERNVDGGAAQIVITLWIGCAVVASMMTWRGGSGTKDAVPETRSDTQ